MNTHNILQNVPLDMGKLPQIPWPVLDTSSLTFQSVLTRAKLMITFDPIIFNIFYIEVVHEQQTIYFINF